MAARQCWPDTLILFERKPPFPNHALFGVLPGADRIYVIFGQRHDRHTSSVHPSAVSGKIKVPIVKAVRPTRIGQGFHVKRLDMQKETCFRIALGTRLLGVDQCAFMQIYVKEGADQGCVGGDRLRYIGQPFRQSLLLPLR